MMTTELDYYAILQIAPDAEREIIDAAYRQLMRKYHPDLARDDVTLAARLHERAKLINQAYAVLRDPDQRREYDRMRLRSSGRVTWTPPPPPRRERSQRSDGSTASGRSAPPWTESAPAAAHASAGRRSEQAGEATAAAPSWWTVETPLRVFDSAYYLLPGPYEWEPRSKREQLFVWMIPPLGVLTWMAATGRLEPLLGRSPYAALGIIVLVLIALLLADWRSMPRFIIAGGLALALATGVVDAYLLAAGVPILIGWLVTGGLGLLLAARAFFFGLLPTMGLCWLLARIG